MYGPIQRADLIPILVPTIMLARTARGPVKKKKVKKIRKKGKKATKQPSSEDFKWMEEDPHDELFSRFVYSRAGERMGESIGVENKHLIVKSEQKFYLVPLAAVDFEADDLRVVRRVDWKKAGRLGNTWKKKNL
jgi:hypothetical protein